MNQWVDFAPTQDGSFTGGATSNSPSNSDYSDLYAGPLALTVRLLP